MQMSAARSGCKNHFFGKKHSAATLAKQSAAKLGKRYIWRNGKRVLDEQLMAAL